MKTISGGNSIEIEESRDINPGKKKRKKKGRKNGGKGKKGRKEDIKEEGKGKKELNRSKRGKISFFVFSKVSKKTGKN